MTVLERLRTPGPVQAKHIFPYDAFMDAITCSVCRCMKSGDASEPNLWQECCEDSLCACHAESFECDDCGQPVGHDLSVEH